MTGQELYEAKARFPWTALRTRAELAEQHKADRTHELGPEMLALLVDIRNTCYFSPSTPWEEMADRLEEIGKAAVAAIDKARAALAKASA